MRPCLLALLAPLLAAAAEPPLQHESAVRALAELARVCDPEGMLLWGKSLCGPVVLVNPSTHDALANRPDPEAKFRKDGDVFAGLFPHEFTPANTSIRWGDQDWATILLPVPADPFDRIKLLVHESFHRIQPALGLSAPDTPDACLDAEAGRLWFRLELRALAAALRSEGASARQSASDAMLFRMYRHRVCPGSEPTDAGLEKQEGLAEYTGVFVAMRETGESISRPARLVEAFEDSSAYARSFAYATGPALGLLLDRYAPAWRAKAATAALDSLLTTALHVQDTQLETRAQRRAAVYGYTAVASAEREREQRHRALLADLKGRFIDGPVLEFPPAAEMMRNFNPSTLVPFPPHGTYYPTGTFAASWGKLHVESGGALVAPDNRSLRVTAPPDPNARPVGGPGWTLEIAPGWTVRPSNTPGTFVVAPLPK